MGPWHRRRGRLAGLALGCAVPWAAGCAEGAIVEPITLGSGTYDLLTFGLDGSCTLTDALTPGAEHVGKVARVQVDASEHAVRLEACDPFFDDCFATVGEPVTLLRSGDDLVVDEPNWEVSACTCFDTYRAERSAVGRLVSNDTVELTWTFTVPAPPANCSCDGWTACEATVEQRLVRP